MKKFSWLAVILIMAMMSWAFINCGSSSDDDEEVGGLTLYLSATQGPNKYVMEPEELVDAEPTVDFSTDFADTAAADARASSVVSTIVSLTGANGSLHNLLLDTMEIGYLVSKIPAEGTPVEEACGKLQTLLEDQDDVGGPCNYSLLTCKLYSESMGLATLAFDTDKAGGCDIPSDDHDITGTMTISGKLLKKSIDPTMVPNVDAHDVDGSGADYDCAAASTDCRDVKIATVTEDLAIPGSSFTAKSVISAYVLNYELNTDDDPEYSWDLEDLPLYLVANVQMDNDNLAMGVLLPYGLNGIFGDIGNGVFDYQGGAYGFAYADVGGSADLDIILITLPLNSTGMDSYNTPYCDSVFLSDAGGTTYTYSPPADGLSEDCGLNAPADVVRP